MIPVEIITLLGSSLIGGALKIWGMSMENKKLQNQLLLDRFNASETSTKDAREGPKRGFKGFAWTRRAIALSAVFSVIVLPKVAALLPNPPQIVYAWAEKTDGALWGFLPESSVQHWVIMEGIVITPIDIYAVMAIIGLYMGNSIVSTK